MTEKPILFSGPMVRAILDGRKTQTRRVVSVPGATLDALDEPVWPMLPGDCHGMQRAACPYDADRLWVRETWAAPHAFDAHAPRNIPAGVRWHYAASEDRGGLLWRPSIHMPRWASRITIVVKSIRVERLHDITEEDAKAEGVAGDLGGGLRAHPGREVDVFRSLWQSINGKRPGCSWADNPWVWRVEFSRVTP